MNEKKYKFGVLPKRLRVHMPKAQLLKDKPAAGHQGTQSFHKHINSPQKRPARKEARATADLSWLAQNIVSC